MKKIVAIITISISLTGCATTQQSELTGAITGAIIGSRFGGGEGRVIATAIGAVAGSQIGREMNKPQAPSVVVQGYPINDKNYCVEEQMQRQMSYGEAVAYCDGKRRRMLEDQQNRQRDAYWRGYNGR